MPAYFIHDGQSELGPFTYEELKRKILTSDTPVWYEGLGQWTTIGRDPDLTSLLTTKPAPPPFIGNVGNPKRETQEELYASAMDEYFPPAKKKFNVPLLIVGLIIIGSLVAWLITKNNRHSETISLLQDQVSTQQAIMRQKEATESLIKQ